MKFKDWLINESGGDASDFFYGLQLYPSDAFDYSQAVSQPTDLFFLKKRWQSEKEQGRHFHNIDEPNFQKTSFIAIQDKDGSPTVVKHNKLINLAIGKDSNDRRELKTKNLPFKVDLDGLFGDKGTNSIPVVNKDFDKPWKKVYENVYDYDVIGSDNSGIRNAGIGVRSKYIGPDETGEKESEKPVKMADFGFNRISKRTSNKKYMKKHK